MPRAFFFVRVPVRAFRTASSLRPAKLSFWRKKETPSADLFRSFRQALRAYAGRRNAFRPMLCTTRCCVPAGESCRYKRSTAGARHARYHSWRDTETQGYPPPVFSVRAGTHADRLRTNLRARREGMMGTLSAVLGVVDRRGACADAWCEVRLALHAVER